MPMDAGVPGDLRYVLVLERGEGAHTPKGSNVVGQLASRPLAELVAAMYALTAFHRVKVVDRNDQAERERDG